MCFSIPDANKMDSTFSIVLSREECILQES